MAFQLPPLPSFNVQTPDLTQKALEGAQLRNMLSEMALRKALAPYQVQQAQQQTQATDIENQMKQMQLQGQRALTDWLSNGDASADVPAENFSSNDKIATFVGVTPNDPIMNVIRSMAQHHVPAPMLVTEAQGMLQRRNEYYKGTKEEQDAQKNERLVWQDALGALHNMPEDQRSAQLAAKLPLLQENSKTDPLLAKYAQGLAGHPELIDQAYNTLTAENAALNLRKAKAEAASAEQKVIPPGGVSPDTAQQIQKDIAVATNPQIQQGKEAVAAAEGRARANLELQMARGSNAALASVPQHLIAPATEAANKAGAEYAQAKSVSDRLAAMMEAAKKGNVVSYQLIPQEGALQVTTSQGVHRINMAEIQNYGGGSLWQRLEGHIGKQLTGESIPASVLKDMEEMQDIQSRGSQSKYENTLKTINQTFGAEFKPVQMEGIKPAAEKPSMIYARDPQGKLHQAPAGTALPSGWKQENRQ